jgi:hypothetical protein
MTGEMEWHDMKSHKMGYEMDVKTLYITCIISVAALSQCSLNIYIYTLFSYTIVIALD